MREEQREVDRNLNCERSNDGSLFARFCVLSAVSVFVRSFLYFAKDIRDVFRRLTCTPYIARKMSRNVDCGNFASLALPGTDI